MQVCGKKFNRRGIKEKSITWGCANGLKTKGGCVNKPIKDIELKEIFMEVYNKFVIKVEEKINNYIDSMDRYENPKILDINEKIDKLNEQIHILTKLRSNGYMESAIFINDN